MTESLPERLPSGAVLDEYYEIGGYLGSGGFADVYHGIQRDTGMRIAVKILKPARDQAAAADFERRFLREARVAAGIRHPNIVTMLAARERMRVELPSRGVSEHRRPYLVMELLQGQPLDRMLAAAGAMTTPRAVGLILGCLDGLAQGHRLGVVHKDLKPGNLFLINPGQRVEALKVLDFGIARLGHSEDGRTDTGHGLYTPQYAAPEYIEHLVATPALDVYQMGLVLAEMLTGAPVVDGATGYACIIRHIEGVALPEALRGTALESVLARALDRDHTRRYPDAGAFALALDEAMARAGGELSDSAPRVPSAPSTLDGPLLASPSTLDGPPPASPATLDGPPLTSSPARDEPPQAAPRPHALVQTLDEAPRGSQATSPDQGGPAPSSSGPPSASTTGGERQPSAQKREDGSGAGRTFLGGALACGGLAIAAGLGVGLLGAAVMWISSNAGGPPGPVEASFAPRCRHPLECAVGDDPKGAYKTFKEACARGEMAGCNDRGLMRRLGFGVKPDAEDAARFMREACDGGDADGCANLGYMIELGLGVERSPARASTLYEEACGGGSVYACANLAYAFEQGIGVPRDTAHAADLYEEACAADHALSCYSLAGAYKQGIGVRDDDRRAHDLYVKARRLFEKGCHHKTWMACSNLAHMLATGTGAPTDADEAMRLYGLACDEGLARACSGLGVMHLQGTGTPKDPWRARELFERACDRQDPDGCENLRLVKDFLRKLSPQEERLLRELLGK